MPPTGLSRVRRVAWVAVVAVLVTAGSTAVDPTRAAFPPLPESTYTAFLTQLDVPVAAPGSSVTLTGLLSNPLVAPMTSVNLTFQLYAFNAYPGNATGPVPTDQAPTFDSPLGAGPVDWFDAASLQAGGSMRLSATLVVPGGAPPGGYAIRTGLEFTANGSGFLLESRGYFSYSEWTNATSTPSGGSTLNLSRLGVSGVLPETVLFVQSNPFPYLLVGLGVGAAVLAAAGGYYAVRRGPGSRSGAR